MTNYCDCIIFTQVQIVFHPFQQFFYLHLTFVCTTWTQSPARSSPTQRLEHNLHCIVPSFEVFVIIAWSWTFRPKHVVITEQKTWLCLTELWRIVLITKDPVVTICTTRHNIYKFYVLPTQCIFVWSGNKQRLFPYTTLTDCFLTLYSPVVTICTTMCNI